MGGSGVTGVVGGAGVTDVVHEGFSVEGVDHEDTGMGSWCSLGCRGRQSGRVEAPGEANLIR